LQLTFDGAVQPLNVIGLDGVPTGSQDGTHLGTSLTQTDILLAPAARAEFILTGPSATVKEAILSTLGVKTGPYGFYDPARPLARIQPSLSAPEPPMTIAAASGPPPAERFAGLATAVPTTQRKLYFSENFSDPQNPCYFITVDGQKPVVFNPSNPPAIVTTQGSIEDWTIENRSLENHAFHIHQIHFLLLEQNGAPVSAANSQYLDTIQIPFWSGTGPYPSVTLRMDFRGQITGDFVYHCHILDHEDKGMMAIIQVNPAPPAGVP
jgi:FtsP/CotA-like multicopper oxidase with cupredoxin domain